MKRIHALKLAWVLVLMSLALLPSACDSGTAAPTASATAAATATVDAAQSVTAEPMVMGVPIGAGSKVSAGEVAAAVASRTPVPTPTPGLIAGKVEEITVAAGLTGNTFLGLPAEDWIDIVISILIGFAGYLLAVLGVRLLLAAARRFVRSTSSEFEDAFVEAIGQEIKWLVMVLVLRYALLRLDFWSERLRILINDVFFFLGLGIVIMMVLKVIKFAAQWYRDHLDPDVDKGRLEPIILLLQRSGYAIVLIFGVSIGLSHFGIQITAVSAALVLIALAISLGARDVISDAISGFIIMVDQPFRVGDVIEIKELDRWGDVVDIGTRTTRIRTRDERFAIVPNSKIGASQVINYTFPDPQYRVYSDIRVAYGSDFDRVRRVATDAVRAVEGVLSDQPVDVLFHEYGVTARIMRVRWWIDDMHKEKHIIDRVHEVLEIAFSKAGIEMPVTTRELIVRSDPETVELYSRSSPSTD
jgi:small-conductance mechanosensitive channel